MVEEKSPGPREAADLEGPAAPGEVPHGAHRPNASQSQLAAGVEWTVRSIALTFRRRFVPTAWLVRGAPLSLSVRLWYATFRSFLCRSSAQRFRYENSTGWLFGRW